MVKLDFEKTNGLIPAIAQDYKTGEVLMLAYMNKASFEETLKSGKATYYSRSRQTLWKKGETSGHMQDVKEIRVDCDHDTILLKVDQVGGAACHKGYKSCFFSRVENNELKIVDTIIFDPKEVYR
ncbi:MAG: phosphoribosyl-AMP cyclohydrolase [Pseudomonadota bacterium]